MGGKTEKSIKKASNILCIVTFMMKNSRICCWKQNKRYLCIVKTQDFYDKQHFT